MEPGDPTIAVPTPSVAARIQAAGLNVVLIGSDVLPEGNLTYQRLARTDWQNWLARIQAFRAESYRARGLNPDQSPTLAAAAQLDSRSIHVLLLDKEGLAGALSMRVLDARVSAETSFVYAAMVTSGSEYHLEDFVPRVKSFIENFVSYYGRIFELSGWVVRENVRGHLPATLMPCCGRIISLAAGCISGVCIANERSRIPLLRLGGTTVDLADGQAAAFFSSYYGRTLQVLKFHRDTFAVTTSWNGLDRYLETVPCLIPEAAP